MSETHHMSFPDEARDPYLSSHRPRDFVRAAWSVGCRAPLLFPWKVIGDAWRLLIRPLALFWVGAVIATGYGIGVQRSGDPLRALAQVDPFVLAAGLGGFVVVFWLAGIVVDSVVGGGILETIADALDGRDVGGALGFFGRTGTGFVRLVGLRLCAAIARTAVTVLGLAAAGAVLYTVGVGEFFREASTLTQTLFLAIPAFLYLVLELLVRATMRVAAAPLFVDRISVGEAIYEGAAFLMEHFRGIYRIFAWVAGVLLVPLVGCWIVAVGTQAWGLEGPLGPLLQSLRIVGQITVLTCFSVAAILFDGAILALYAQTRGRVDIRATGDADDAGPDGTDSPYDESTTLEQLLPESPDGIVTIPSPNFSEQEDASG